MAPKNCNSYPMQFLNDIIKSRHGFKTAQKFHKFRVLIKTNELILFNCIECCVTNSSWFPIKCKVNFVFDTQD